MSAVVDIEVPAGLPTQMFIGGEHVDAEGREKGMAALASYCQVKCLTARI